MKKSLIILVLLSLALSPNLALAAWWNPFTWQIFQKPPEARVQMTPLVVPAPPNVLPVETETELAQKEEPKNTDNPVEIEKQKVEIKPQPPSAQSVSSNVVVPQRVSSQSNANTDQCQIAKQAYGKAALKIDSELNKQLDVIRINIESAHRNAINKIVSTPTPSLAGLSPAAGTQMLRDSTLDMEILIDKINQSYQQLWQDKKAEIGRIRQTGINQLIEQVLNPYCPDEIFSAITQQRNTSPTSNTTIPPTSSLQLQRERDLQQQIDDLKRVNSQQEAQKFIDSLHQVPNTLEFPKLVSPPIKPSYQIYWQGSNQGFISGSNGERYDFHCDNVSCVAY